MLVSEGMDVSYYSRIPQMQEGVIYYGTIRGGGVKNGEVSVARGRAIEIRMGEGASMEGGSISGGKF